MVISSARRQGGWILRSGVCLWFSFYRCFKQGRDFCGNTKALYRGASVGDIKGILGV